MLVFTVVVFIQHGWGVGSELSYGCHTGNRTLTNNKVLIRRSEPDMFYLVKTTGLLLCCHTDFPIESSLEMVLEKQIL